MLTSSPLLLINSFCGTSCRLQLHLGHSASWWSQPVRHHRLLLSLVVSQVARSRLVSVLAANRNWKLWSGRRAETRWSPQWVWLAETPVNQGENTPRANRPQRPAAVLSPLHWSGFSSRLLSAVGSQTSQQNLKFQSDAFKVPVLHFLSENGWI